VRRFARFRALRLLRQHLQRQNSCAVLVLSLDVWHHCLGPSYVRIASHSELKTRNRTFLLRRRLNDGSFLGLRLFNLLFTKQITFKLHQPALALLL
jgi:hypothetical protein